MQHRIRVVLAGLTAAPPRGARRAGAPGSDTGYRQSVFGYEVSFGTPRRRSMAGRGVAARQPSLRQRWPAGGPRKRATPTWPCASQDWIRTAIVEQTNREGADLRPPARQQEEQRGDPDQGAPAVAGGRGAGAGGRARQLRRFAHRSRALRAGESVRGRQTEGRNFTTFLVSKQLVKVGPSDALAGTIELAEVNG